MNTGVLHKLNRKKTQQGLSMIEILVAVIVMAIGLLGLASLQVNGLRSNQNAYLRSQATTLAADIADRMRRNSGAAIAGQYNGFSTKGYAGTPPGCSTNVTGCTATQLVALDKAEWASTINGIASGVKLLPEGEGIITRLAGNLFNIQINWTASEWDEETSEEKPKTASLSMNFSL